MCAAATAAIAVAMVPPVARPAGDGRLEAYFAARSYAPGQRAGLLVRAPARSIVGIQIFRAGPSMRRSDGGNVLRGIPVASVRRVRSHPTGEWRTVTLQIHFWPSGLYFARLEARGRIAYAPFVLRANPFERRRVAIVLPTNTWQAYNKRDDDGDGVADSWYASPTVTSVRLDRPFLERGVPPSFRGYDQPMIAWLARSGKQADYLADDDLERYRTGRHLASLYDLIVFAGHEEYVTSHAYDVVEAYRDLGGNLAFLSANNFFYRVVRAGAQITRAGRWRDLGRPEAALVGVQYIGWSENIHSNAPYVVTGATAAPWLFAGTGLADGDRFGVFGIEIDARAPQSPRGTLVLATAPNIFGAGRSAEMTYYETDRGAKVFAAGVLNFGGAAWLPHVSRMLENIWARLSTP